MNKHLLAVAVATAVAAPAMAQNVSVSGTLDGGYYSTDTSYGTASTKHQGVGLESRNATSEIVLSGTEDLGQGMKAFFKFSSAIGSPTDTAAEATDTSNSGGLAARDVFLGLSGSFGSVRIGRFTPITETVGNSFTYGVTTFLGHAIDSSASTNQLTRSVFTPGRVANDFSTTAISTIDFGRKDDNIELTLPTMSGFTATLGYSNANRDEGTNVYSVTQTDLAVNYGKRPLKVGVAKANQDFRAGASTTLVEGDLSLLGASYNFGFVEAKVVRASNKVKLNGANIQKPNVTGFGLQAPVGSGTAYVSYSIGSNKGGTNEALQTKEAKATQVGYLHPLSKRTTAYAMYGANSAAIVSTSVQEKVNGYAVGLKHSF